LMWFYYWLTKYVTDIQKETKGWKAWVDEKAQQGTQFHYQ